MGYHVEGRLLEVCNCEILCPCWVGEDADPGTCDAVVAWHIDQGAIDGLDVSGHTIALINHIPGNILAGNWKVVFFVDDRASTDQREAMLSVWTGKRGGPIADLAGLYGEVTAADPVPISFQVEGGQGTLLIGDSATPTVDAVLAPFMGATGRATTLVDTVFSTIPGSPAYVGKAEHYRRNSARHGLRDMNVTGHNAIQGTFRFEA